MAAIKNSSTCLEVRVRKALFAKGYRYRVNVKSLPGSPDMVLSKFKVAIFVHGCFWHGHANCRRAKPPASNSDFWISKIAKNKQRDSKANAELRKKHWRIITVWECKLKNQKEFERSMKRIINEIKKHKA